MVVSGALWNYRVGPETSRGESDCDADYRTFCLSASCSSLQITRLNGQLASHLDTSDTLARLPSHLFLQRRAFERVHPLQLACPSRRDKCVTPIYNRAVISTRHPSPNNSKAIFDRHSLYEMDVKAKKERGRGDRGCKRN